jgi:CubicO group peptidase (beta-lactamase class C family)
MKRIHDYLQEQYPLPGPGAAVLVARGDDLFLEGYGQADATKERPIEVDTQFDIASLAKQFTAFCVFSLICRRSIALNDEVRRHLPRFPLWRPKLSRPTRETTIGDLIFHTSGLPEYFDHAKRLAKTDQDRFSNSDVIDWLASQHLKFAPGEKGSFDYEPETYSSTNYVVLAEVIETVTGERFADVLKQTIFCPLDMPNTELDTSFAQSPRRARRYRERGKNARSIRSIPTSGDGNVYSTIGDMSRWVGELRRPALISSEEIAAYLTPGRLNNGKVTEYAYGLQLHSTPVGRLLYHDGSWDGTTACIFHWLDRPSSVVVLSNCEVPPADKTGWAIGKTLGLID